jgi:hypothetical protein
MGTRGITAAFKTIQAVTKLLPIVESAGACAKTSFAAIWTNDDEGGAFATAGDANRIFGSLDAIHKGPLQGRLDDFARNHGGCRLLAIHLELSAVHGSLHRQCLFAVQKLALCGAPHYRQHRY